MNLACRLERLTIVVAAVEVVAAGAVVVVAVVVVATAAEAKKCFQLHLVAFAILAEKAAWYPSSLLATTLSLPTRIRMKGFLSIA